MNDSPPPLRDRFADGVRVATSAVRVATSIASSGGSSG
jgi:hypothetical protein